MCSSKIENSEEKRQASDTETAPPCDTATVNLDGEENKTLGVVWNPRKDIIPFTSKEVKVEKLTKRTVLSRISKLYDPLGLATAVTIKARIAFQSIWKAQQFNWDDLLPEEMSETWTKLFKEIESLKGVEFPSCLQPKDVCGPSHLHVFAETSKAAYGAVAYLVWETHRCPRGSLVSAKARVAPLRHTTIPRLELITALVASLDTFRVEFFQAFRWSLCCRNPNVMESQCLAIYTNRRKSSR